MTPNNGSNLHQHSTLDTQTLASMIDHTVLHADCTAWRIRQLCAEALQYQFATVCVNPTWVPLAADLLAQSPVKVCTVIGFPLGATSTRVKAFETNAVLEAGASEVDMVINIGLLKDGQDSAVLADIASVVDATRTFQALGDGDRTQLVKVILETALLSQDEKRRACLLALEAGADYVKTSTGFAKGGATIADVELMRQTIGANMGVKAAGGIRSAADALAMVRAGANRLGTSTGVTIIQELLSQPTNK